MSWMTAKPRRESLNLNKRPLSGRGDDVANDWHWVLTDARLPSAAPTSGLPAKPAWCGMEEFESLEGDDDWDSDFANDLVGCTLLIGLTFVDHEDRLLRRQQLFGTISSVDRRAGIVIRQGNGEEFVLAPVLDAIEAASPGIYQLADEDASVEDPDFTALLTVRSPLRS